jgi:hypothetical protein
MRHVLRSLVARHENSLIPEEGKMIIDESKALMLIEGGMELLRNAIVNGDPQRELELRARDLLAEIRAVNLGLAKTVAAFAPHI